MIRPGGLGKIDMLLEWVPQAREVNVVLPTTFQLCCVMRDELSNITANSHVCAVVVAHVHRQLSVI
jgi:hypothetical protein